MSDKWSHEELGLFRNDIEFWEGSMPLPAFGMYPLADDIEDLEDAPLPDGHVLFRFSMNQTNDQAPPSDQQVEAALAFLRDAEKIAPAILEALWADIQGTGPDSGMWWHGNLEEVNFNGMYEEMGGTPVTDPASLQQSLELGGVIVGTFEDPLLVEVNFNPQWEEEHGVGVLIKEGRVVGIGYMMDATVFADLAEG